MHAACAREDAGVDRFACDVAVDDTTDDDLECQLHSSRTGRFTVGKAMPYVILEINGPAELRAGDSTLGPA